MSNQEQGTEAGHVSGLYHEHEEWEVNTGGKTIHSKRMAGKFRTLKYLTASTWAVFFFGAYLRWNGKQAILFDVTNRQFHFFNITILPQDIWMLSLLLLLRARAFLNRRS